MSTVLITGGTGMVGKRLIHMLHSNGYDIIVLTREIPSDTSQNNSVTYALWDIQNQTIDMEAVKKADYIIHLAGAGVMDKRWTQQYKQEIVDSRVNSASLIIKALQNIDHHVKAIISASAIGWYGADKKPPTPFVETEKADNGFLGQTCKLWEQSVEAAVDLGIRVVKYRIGIVLSNDGGALAEFKKPLKFGIAAILGSGKQIITCIHIDDLCRLFIYGIENNELNGSYNAVAPHPISNKSFMLTLGKAIKGNFFMPIHVPTFFLKMILGEKSIEILKSTTVSAEKMQKAGFEFLYPNIKVAFSNLFINQR